MKKIQIELDRALEAKNQLAVQLVAEKDAKTQLIQEFARENANMGGTPNNSKKSTKKIV